MISFLLRLAVTAMAIFAAVRLLPGLHFEGSAATLAGVALVFGTINAFLRPILGLLTCPLQLLTLGLFTFVVNGALLLLTAWVSQRLGFDFRVDGLLWAVLGSVVIGVISTALSLITPKGD
ncbi:MAG: phage holin family protein [Gemmatimonadales bacterium]|jgi:putative membrane protein|nr:phage holin family protein [Gemmatimonadales bacterium]